jgi:hypothetical protein
MKAKSRRRPVLSDLIGDGLAGIYIEATVLGCYYRGRYGEDDGANAEEAADEVIAGEDHEMRGVLRLNWLFQVRVEMEMKFL